MISPHTRQMQRLYNKYLKSESFRKSLIWQKKYLLILIGGYRDSEQQTLAALSRINAGGEPHCVGISLIRSPSHHYRCSSNPKEFFKSRVMVLIAISRLVPLFGYCLIIFYTIEKYLAIFFKF